MDTYNLFKCLGGTIETEDQFATWMYKMFGPGEYYILAFSKGVHGFWNFYKVCLEPDGFTRGQKKQSPEKKEIAKSLTDLRLLEKRLNIASNNEEYNKILSEIQEVKDEIDFNKDIDKLGNGSRGFSGYLKPTTPAYKKHSYVGERNVDKNEVEAKDFW